MGRLEGKVAAVTGGASGIGEATVRRFVAEGASVAFCDRDGERGQRVAAELEAAGAKVFFMQADVGTEAACLGFVNGAAQKFGRLDILVNNAGIRKYEKVDEASGASWNEILSVNLMSYVFCAKAAVPLMRGNKGGAPGGAIVLKRLDEHAIKLDIRPELLTLVRKIYDRKLQRAQAQLNPADDGEIEIEVGALRHLRLELLGTERRVVIEQRDHGTISDDVLRRIERSLDYEELRQQE